MASKKMKSVVVIKADDAEPVLLIEIPNTLEAQQALVGGLIQPVNIGHGRTLWCNEEGLLQGLATNHRAIRLTGGRHHIVGDVFITGRDLAAVVV